MLSDSPTGDARFLDFLPLPARSSKPRSSGLTIARDDGLGFAEAASLLETLAPFVDYIKTRHLFTMLATDSADDPMLRKVALYREHEIDVFPGGIVFEIAFASGVQERYFHAIAERGWSAVECSENIIRLSDDQRRDVIGQARAAGLKVLYEFGDKYPTRYEEVDAVAEQLERLREWGAEKLIIERSYTDALLGPNADRPEAEWIIELVQRTGIDVVTFEAESPTHQRWLLQTFGPDVNLGPNFPLAAVQHLEPTRRTLSRDGGYSWLSDFAREKGIPVAEDG